MLALGGHGQRQIGVEAVALPVFIGQAHELRVVAQIGLHIQQAVPVGHGGLVQELAALPQGGVGAVFLPVVIDIVGDLLGRQLDALQQLDKALGIKAAFAGLPVDIVRHVVGAESLQQVGLVGVKAHHHGAVLQLGHGLPGLVHGQAGHIAYHLAVGNGRLDLEAGGDGIELAVVGAQRVHHGLHQTVFPAQRSIVLDVGGQILQQALGAVEAHRQVVAGQDIGHVAGDDLRGELLPAGSPVVVGVVFAIVLDHDAILGVAAVKALDGRAQIPIQIHHRHGQLLPAVLLGDQRPVQLHQAAFGNVLRPVGLEEHDLLPAEDGQVAHIVRIHVAAEPIQQLFRRAVVLHAVEAAGGAVEVEIIALAGGIVIDIVVVFRVGHFAVHRPGLGVDGFQALAPELDGHPAIGQTHQRVVHVVLALAGEQPAVGRDHHQIAHGGDIGVAAAVHPEAVGPEVIIALLAGVQALALEIHGLQIHGGKLRAGLAELAQQALAAAVFIIVPAVIRLGVEVFRQIVIILIHAFQHQNAAVRPGLDGVEAGAALHARVHLRHLIVLQANQVGAVQLDAVKADPRQGGAVAIDRLVGQDRVVHRLTLGRLRRLLLRGRRVVGDGAVVIIDVGIEICPVAADGRRIDAVCKGVSVFILQLMIGGQEHILLLLRLVLLAAARQQRRRRQAGQHERDHFLCHKAPSVFIPYSTDLLCAFFITARSLWQNRRRFFKKVPVSRRFPEISTQDLRQLYHSISLLFSPVV